MVAVALQKNDEETDEDTERRDKRHKHTKTVVAEHIVKHTHWSFIRECVSDREK